MGNSEEGGNEPDGRDAEPSRLGVAAIASACHRSAAARKALLSAARSVGNGVRIGGVALGRRRAARRGRRIAARGDRRGACREGRHTGGALRRGLPGPAGVAAYSGLVRRRGLSAPPLRRAHRRDRGRGQGALGAGGLMRTRRVRGVLGVKRPTLLHGGVAFAFAVALQIAPEPPRQLLLVEADELHVTLRHGLDDPGHGGGSGTAIAVDRLLIGVVHRLRPREARLPVGHHLCRRGV